MIPDFLTRRRIPLSVPAHFPEGDFRELWVELDAALRPRAEHAAELEMAVLLVADLRRSGPDWPDERYRVLADLVRGIRDGRSAT